MSDRTCIHCGKTFSAPCRLQTHYNRKTPCVQENKACVCVKCGNSYTTPQALSRHKHNTCTGPTDEEKNDDIRQQLDKLTIMVQQLTQAPQSSITNNGPINTGTISNTVNQMNNISVMRVHPWDDVCCINVDTSQIAAAFRENPLLLNYTQLGDHAMADRETGTPYVDEMLMELVKRAHEDPANRNIYLNPRRLDQVLVLMKTGDWEVLPLSKATRLMYDGIVDCMRTVRISPEEAKQLPLAAQNALAIAGLLYNVEPDGYAKRAGCSMSAHLTNCRNKVSNVQSIAAPRTEPVKRVPQYTPPPVPKAPTLMTPNGPITYVPRYPDPERPTLNAERAAAAFRKMRPNVANGGVCPEYIKKLAASVNTEVDIMIKKLWESIEEDRILEGDDAELANAVIVEYDADRSQY